MSDIIEALARGYRLRRAAFAVWHTVFREGVEECSAGYNDRGHPVEVKELHDALADVDIPMTAVAIPKHGEKPIADVVILSLAEVDTLRACFLSLDAEKWFYDSDVEADRDLYRRIVGP